MQSKHGFMDYVKNPSLFWREVADSAPADGVMSDKQIAAAVVRMAKRKLSYEVVNSLEMAGNRVVPFLLEALQNPKFQTRLYGKSICDGSPLETALKLLEPFALPPTELLSTALNDRNENIRSEALNHLGRCGNDDAISALKVGLLSNSERCRESTLYGFQALDESRGSTRFRQDLFDESVPLLNGKKHGPLRAAPYALLSLDRERAIGVLYRDDIFNPDYYYLLDVLKALEINKVPVPPKKLLGLLDSIKSRATKYPDDSIYAYCLSSLAETNSPVVADLIEDAKSWGNKCVRDAAAAASVRLVGVTDAYGVVIETYQTLGIKGLSPPQLHYLALSWLNGEVNNGGFAQFFFNSTGELAIYTVDAARAVGAKQKAAVIAKVMSLFGPIGPDTNREVRMDQLSDVDKDALSELDSEYYKATDSISELLSNYVVKHAEEFRKKI